MTDLVQGLSAATRTAVAALSGSQGRREERRRRHSEALLPSFEEAVKNLRSRAPDVATGTTPFLWLPFGRMETDGKSMRTHIVFGVPVDRVPFLNSLSAHLDSGYPEIRGRLGDASTATHRAVAAFERWVADVRERVQEVSPLPAYYQSGPEPPRYIAPNGVARFLLDETRSRLSTGNPWHSAFGVKPTSNGGHRLGTEGICLAISPDPEEVAAVQAWVEGLLRNPEWTGRVSALMQGEAEASRLTEKAAESVEKEIVEPVRLGGSLRGSCDVCRGGLRLGGRRKPG